MRIHHVAPHTTGPAWQVKTRGAGVRQVLIRSWPSEATARVSIHLPHVSEPGFTYRQIDAGIETLFATEQDARIKAVRIRTIVRSPAHRSYLRHRPAEPEWTPGQSVAAAVALAAWMMGMAI